MNSTPIKKFWGSARRWLPGVLISLAAVVAILYFVDLQDFVNAIRSANYWLLAAVVGCMLVWMVVRAFAWRSLLRKRATFRDVYLTLNEGYLLNNFLLFRLGEVGMAFLLGRKAKLGFMDVFSTVVVMRVVDVAFSAAILLSALPFVAGASSAGPIALVIVALVVVGLVVLYLAARNREKLVGWFERVTARRPKLQKLGGEFISPLFSGLAVLTDGWLFLRFLLWMALDWAIAIGQFYLLLLAFFPQAQLTWSLFGLGAVAFGNAIPSMPGAIGTYDAALAGAITLVSGDESTALALTVTSHLFNYLVTGVIGLIALSREGETLMGIYRQIRARRTGQAETGSEPGAQKEE